MGSQKNETTLRMFLTVNVFDLVIGYYVNESKDTGSFHFFKQTKRMESNCLDSFKHG